MAKTKQEKEFEKRLNDERDADAKKKQDDTDYEDFKERKVEEDKNNEDAYQNYKSGKQDLSRKDLEVKGYEQKEDSKTDICDSCGETVLKTAKKCKHCGVEFEDEEEEEENE